MAAFVAVAVLEVRGLCLQGRRVDSLWSISSSTSPVSDFPSCVYAYTLIVELCADGLASKAQDAVYVHGPLHSHAPVARADALQTWRPAEKQTLRSPRISTRWFTAVESAQIDFCMPGGEQALYRTGHPRARSVRSIHGCL
jgi:hypothetical protein